MHLNNFSYCVFTGKLIPKLTIHPSKSETDVKEQDRKGRRLFHDQIYNIAQDRQNFGFQKAMYMYKQKMGIIETHGMYIRAVQRLGIYLICVI